MFKFYQAFFKRFLDIIISLIIIVVMSPFFLLLYLVSSISTKENGIFVQKRVGHLGRLFNLYKFKTMIGKSNSDRGIAALSNSRITSLGKILRKTHFDELPQLFMVFFGSMSLVGPRPEVPSITNMLNKEDLLVLTSIKPGLVSSASLKYINEEALLKCSENPEDYYLEEILPDKIIMNREYLSNVSFINDINILISYFIIVLRLK